MPIPKAVNTRFAKDICLRAIMCNITMKITNTIILISVRKAFMNVTPQIFEYNSDWYAKNNINFKIFQEGICN